MTESDASMGKRLNKFISESGFCSRREADKLIEQNRVTINGQVPELGTKVLVGDRVCVDKKPISAMPDNKSDRVYIAYNKPIGITCTTERHVKGNIIDAIRHKERIFPIGRLDKPSEGLIFLTSDGDIVNKILRAENAHDKEYVVTVDKPISERFLQRMAKGVPILGTITKPCVVNMKSKFVFSIILTQGLNRQIRRMCEYLGYEVTKLKRTRIMNVELGGLKPGKWRNLSEKEMAEINAAVAHSRKTASNEVSETKPVNKGEQQKQKNAKQNPKGAQQKSRGREQNKPQPNDSSDTRSNRKPDAGKNKPKPTTKPAANKSKYNNPKYNNPRRKPAKSTLSLKK